MENLEKNKSSRQVRVHKRKSTFVVGLVVGLSAIAAAFLAAILLGVLFYNPAETSDGLLKFNSEKEKIASKLYDKIQQTDLENHYPTTPEGVVDFYNDTFYMIYSNMIESDETLKEILIRQREVYSSELLESSNQEVQLSNLKLHLANLYKSGNICLNVERKGTVYDEENAKNCQVQVIMYYNTFGSIYRN